MKRAGAEQLDRDRGMCQNIQGKEREIMYCYKCGAKIDDCALFCPNCGAELSSGPGESRNYNNDNYSRCGNDVDYACGVRQRSLIWAVIFSIITCGIYQMYWFAALTNEINRMTDVPPRTSGGLSLVLNIITFGIYGFYWSYKMGEKVTDIRRRHGAYDGGNTNVIYLILYLFVAGIVVLAFCQNEVNNVTPE